MAAVHISSGTTTANTVKTVTFPLRYDGIQVINRSTGDLWARFDGVDPTIAGDDCFYVAPQSYLDVTNPKPPQDSSGTITTEIRMISAATADYTVSAGV